MTLVQILDLSSLPWCHKF